MSMIGAPIDLVFCGHLYIGPPAVLVARRPASRQDDHPDAWNASLVAPEPVAARAAEAGVVSNRTMPAAGQSARRDDGHILMLDLGRKLPVMHIACSHGQLSIRSIY